MPYYFAQKTDPYWASACEMLFVWVRGRGLDEEGNRVLRLGVEWYGSELGDVVLERKNLIFVQGDTATYAMGPIVTGGLNYVCAGGILEEDYKVTQDAERQKVILERLVREIKLKMNVYEAHGRSVGIYCPEGVDWEVFQDLIMKELGEVKQEIWLWEEVGEEG